VRVSRSRELHNNTQCPITYTCSSRVWVCMCSLRTDLARRRWLRYIYKGMCAVYVRSFTSMLPGADPDWMQIITNLHLPQQKWFLSYFICCCPKKTAYLLGILLCVLCLVWRNELSMEIEMIALIFVAMKWKTSIYVLNIMEWFNLKQNFWK
jgi:hypothetical protein